MNYFRIQHCDGLEGKRLKAAGIAILYEDGLWVLTNSLH